MQYQIYVTEHFKKQLKPYTKKYRRLGEDINSALKVFNKMSAISLGAQTYKMRVHSSDIQRGRSHAFRMIILFVETDNIIAPVTLYFKGDQATIKRKEIAYHAKIVKAEIEQLLLI
jgi:hypothetical protein